MLDKKKHIHNDLEDQLTQQRELTQKMFLEKSKDSSSRESTLQS